MDAPANTSTAPSFVEPYPGWAQENRGPIIVGVSAAMTGLALLFVIARVYSRLVSLGRLGVDDCIVIASIALSISYLGLAGAAVSYGGGRHLATLPPEDAKRAMYYVIVAWVPGVLSFTIPKFAVLILLAKVLDPGRCHRILMWIISAVYLLLLIGLLVVIFAQCSPAAAQWGGAEGTCWDRRITLAYSLVHGIYSAVFDFYLAAYPTFVLCRMHLNWRKKLALSSALGFGYCACAITSYKCYTLSHLLEIDDFTYAVHDVVLWTNIEGNCVLIGACIPTLFPIVKKLFGASALSGSSKKDSTLVTFGSLPIARRPTKGNLGLSHLDTINEEPITLQDRSWHASTTSLRAEQATKQGEAGQQRPHQDDEGDADRLSR